MLLAAQASDGLRGRTPERLPGRLHVRLAQARQVAVDVRRAFELQEIPQLHEPAAALQPHALLQRRLYLSVDLQNLLRVHSMMLCTEFQNNWSSRRDQTEHLAHARRKLFVPRPGIHVVLDRHHVTGIADLDAAGIGEMEPM